MARGMILSGMARNVLTVGVDVQSRLLDRADQNTWFIFGDGAGAAIISAGSSGHQIRHVSLGADAHLRRVQRQRVGAAQGQVPGVVQGDFGHDARGIRLDSRRWLVTVQHEQVGADRGKVEHDLGDPFALAAREWAGGASTMASSPASRPRTVSSAVPPRAPESNPIPEAGDASPWARVRP